jgi:hypothetical protein
MRSLGKNDWPLVFIRPRHADMGRWLKRIMIFPLSTGLCCRNLPSVR